MPAARSLATRLLPRLAGALAVTVGLVVVAGWLSPIRNLRTLLLPISPMRGDTALCFVLTGLSLLAKSGAFNRLIVRIGQACAVAVALRAGLTVLAVVSGWEP